MSKQSFDEFFAEAMGRDPKECGAHPYQRAIAKENDLPELLCVPTGCGKTAAMVLGWLWRRFRHESANVRAATPRRLVYCLPMRTLVEQVRASVVSWLRNLDLLAGDVGVGNDAYRPTWADGRIPVFTLMGGEERADWQAYPEREAVLVGTQDMLLSRALNRGYAAFPSRWPVDFGVINTDALWVLDEAQIMGVGRTTSAQLQFFATRRTTENVRAAPRKSVWMSATLGVGDREPPDSGRERVEVPTWMRTPERAANAESLVMQTLSRQEREAPTGKDEPSELQRVVHASKLLMLRTKGNECWTFENDALVREIVNSAKGRLTLAVVNTVARARVLFDRVQTATQAFSQGQRPDVVLLHSRLRACDRASHLARVTDSLPPAGRIVVSTQVLEAGVDLDAHSLYTEVAPWPSLVQRFGRLNRRGRHQGAQAVVFDVPFDDSKAQKLTKKEERQKALEEAQTAAARPYDWADLEEGRAQLAGINGSLPTLDKLPRLSLPLDGPVLRQFHVADAFDTDPDLSGGHTDVSGFIRSRERDLDVYLLWRLIGEDLDEQPPPHSDEICAVPVYELTQALRGKQAHRLSFGKRHRRKHAWEGLRIAEGSVRAGDTLMLDLQVGGYTEERGWLGPGQDAGRSKPTTYVARHGDRRAWLRATPAGAEPVADIDDRLRGYAGRDRDPRSCVHRWMTLDAHLAAAEQFADQIVRDLVSEEMRRRVSCAARWHDVGKGLERRWHDETTRPFQNMLRLAGVADNGRPEDGVLYAKSNRRGGKGAGFRHEVASALAYVDLHQDDADELIAYLIMCHHGKVRLLPEPWDEQRMDDANGVRPGDALPAVALNGLGTSTELVRLEPAKLLAAKDRVSWQGRVARLLEEYGPFELAYLEALLRVADWRASE